MIIAYVGSYKWCMDDAMAGKFDFHFMDFFSIDRLKLMLSAALCIYKCVCAHTHTHTHYSIRRRPNPAEISPSLRQTKQSRSRMFSSASPEREKKQLLSAEHISEREIQLHFEARE